MKKLIIMFLAVGFALAFTNNVKAQQNIEVTAEVLQAIAFSGLVNVSFGNVQVGFPAEIQANEGDTTDDANASDPTPGSITITGGAADYTIEQTQAPVLSNNSVTLNFTPRYFSSAEVDLTTAITTGGGHEVTGGGAITINIGGQLEAPSETGSYTTASGAGAQNIILTVSYSGF